MTEEIKELVDTNMNTIKDIENQYKGTGSLIRELGYAIFEVLEELDIENNKELFEKLSTISEMANILESRLRKKNSDMIERDTVEYLFKKLEFNITTSTLPAIACKDNNKPIISKNDVKKKIRDLLDEINYIA